MSEFYAFAGEHPFLAFFAMLFAYECIRVVAFLLPNRIIRSANIRAKGWPPHHLDADGDWKPEKDQ